MDEWISMARLNCKRIPWERAMIKRIDVWYFAAYRLAYYYLMSLYVVPGLREHNNV